jgi:predicted glycoside hydrolase/deacetylase ChbG (UPF0249 family)
LPSLKRLIINADDFGLHPSINTAIAIAHQKGLVTSTSLMSGCKLAPAYEHAIALLTDLPALDVGLHFTLVGAPGLPPNYTGFAHAKALGAFPRSRLTTLLRRQLDTLLQSGVKVSHIDSHQHLHALPSVMRVVASVAKEYGITAVRLPLERGPYGGASHVRIGASKILALLCLYSRRELTRSGIAFPDNFGGMAISGSLSPASLTELLSQLRSGVTEILCHPGSNNIELSDAFGWGYDWEEELNAVTSTDVIARAEDFKIMSTTFSEMGKHS